MANDDKPNEVTPTIIEPVKIQSDLSTCEKALYKENPWLFIQKKLIEDPNDELMSFLILFLDVLSVGINTGIMTIATRGKHLSFEELFAIYLASPAISLALVNYGHKRNAKYMALVKFLRNYTYSDYKNYTPLSLQPMFDEFAKEVSANSKLLEKIQKATDAKDYESLQRLFGELFEKKKDQLEDLNEIQRAVEEHNPAFKIDDNLHKKMKFLAGTLISIACIYTLIKFDKRMANIANRLSNS